MRIPNSKDSGLFDEADDHFYSHVVDKEGWSMSVGIGLKMVHRSE